MRYGDEKSFDKNFHFTDRMWNDILKEAKDKKVTGTDQQKAVAKSMTAQLVKAYIARNIFGDEAFYPLYEPLDEVLKEALNQ